MGVGRLAGTCSMYEIQNLFGYATKEVIMKEVNRAIREYYQTFSGDNKNNPPTIIYNHSERGGSLQVWLDCGFIPMYTYKSPHIGDITITHLVYGKVMQCLSGQPLIHNPDEEELETDEYIEEEDEEDSNEEIEEEVE